MDWSTIGLVILAAAAIFIIGRRGGT